MKQTWKAFKRVLPYLRTYWKLAVYALIFTFLSAGVSLLLPWPLALTFDSVAGEEPLPGVLTFLRSMDRFTLLVLLALAGLGLVAGQGMIQVLSEYVTTKLDQRMVLDFHSYRFQHAQRLPLSYRIMFAILAGGAAPGRSWVVFVTLVVVAVVFVLRTLWECAVAVSTHLCMLDRFGNISVLSADGHSRAEMRENARIC